MRLNGFRCDTCCKEHLLDPTLILQSYREVLPAEWFMVSQGPYPKDKPWDQQEPLLFCSVACIAQWAEKHVIAAVPHSAEHAKQVEAFQATPDYLTTLQQLGEVPRKRLMQGNWLPGDEE